MEYTFGAPLPGYGVVSSQPAPPRTQPAAVMQSVQYVGPCRPTGPAPSLGLGSPLPEARITATASMPRMWESIPVGAQPQEVDPRTSSGWHPSQTYVSTRDAPAEGSQVVSAQTTQSGPSVALNAAPAPRRLSDSLSTQHSPQKAPQARAAERRPKGLPPFYWVPAVDRISEFEVSGSCGELVTKTGHYQDSGALQIASTMRMAAGGLYLWTLQIVQQCAERPEVHFGVQGTDYARPWRFVSALRCARSRDDGPWLSRPGGDLPIAVGDFIHCEADLRGLKSTLGLFSMAVNDGPYEVVFEDLPLRERALQPVVAIGGNGTVIRVCGT